MTAERLPAAASDMRPARRPSRPTAPSWLARWARVFRPEESRRSRPDHAEQAAAEAYRARVDSGRTRFWT